MTRCDTLPEQYRYCVGAVRLPFLLSNAPCWIVNIIAGNRIERIYEQTE